MSKEFLTPKTTVYTFNTLEEAITASGEITSLGNRFCKNNQDCDFTVEMKVGLDNLWTVVLTVFSI